MLQSVSQSASWISKSPQSGRLSATKPGLRHSTPVPVHLPSSGRSALRFGGDKDKGDSFNSDTKEIDAECERLIHESPAAWGRKLLLVSPDIFASRARFNITRDPANLHGFLPYRKKLAESASPALKQYDALTEKILKQAEFYQAPSYDKFKETFRPLYNGNKGEPSSVWQRIASFFKKVCLLLRSWFMDTDDFRQYKLNYGKSLQEKAKNIDDQALKQVFANSTTPLTDPSTRYVIAAGIAELLHRHPEYADSVLKPEHGRPLRFVVTDELPNLLHGQTNFGSNVIWMNQLAFWLASQKQCSIPQHEFTHAWSESSGLTSLPVMNEAQRKRFERDRKALFKQYDEQDNHLMGRIRALQSGDGPSVGIGSYGFHDLLEFLPVTLDYFKLNPKQLCKTEAGKDLYNLYKEIFDLDPMQDLPQKEPKQKAKAAQNTDDGTGSDIEEEAFATL